VRRSSWRAKNHRRRVQCRAEFDEVTAEFERNLRTKTRRCQLCKVSMTNRPYLPNSKELDHIVPRNVGGTHTVGNVRIICRLCNQQRPKDGSDYTGPVTLWALAEAG
jgi:5-methylcytosine-specific restriction endonuclease McrA